MEEPDAATAAETGAATDAATGAATGATTGAARDNKVEATVGDVKGEKVWADHPTYMEEEPWPGDLQAKWPDFTPGV